MDSENGLGGLRLGDCEPKDWFVVFHENRGRWWVDWLACGRFKHVSVFGKVERSGAWVFYDFHLDRAHIMVVGDWEADIAIGHYADMGTVVRFPRLLSNVGAFAFRPGWWCVPAVAHIIGLRTCALRPDALFRQCLANGGEIVGREGQNDDPENQG
ncbi:MAG: hypothetical protein K0M55_15990 [Rhizobium sp.]|nr:hypothetical protein [Rhizobium sp.]MBW8321991.1 hypothetical protein [Rhizobium sp.]MBW8447911.1 hypothetical protein [Arenimonas sp.]